MKVFTLIFMTFFLAKSCDAQMNEEMENTTVEYQAMSRGMYLNIHIHSDDLTISRSRKGETLTTKLSQADFKEVATLLRNIKLEQLPDLKAPTEKRMYDGAAHANLKIVHDGKVYETSGFDHGEPPAEIRKLVDKLLTFTKQE